MGKFSIIFYLIILVRVSNIVYISKEKNCIHKMSIKDVQGEWGVKLKYNGCGEEERL